MCIVLAGGLLLGIPVYGGYGAVLYWVLGVLLAAGAGLGSIKLPKFRRTLLPSGLRWPNLPQIN